MEKIKTPVCSEVVERIKSQGYYRIVVFGASNTDRYMVTTHWSDVLEVGLRSYYGKKPHVINSGVSGNNTREGLARFDRDVASFSPDIVIITFAGNDCNPAPAKFVPEDEFRRNLLLMAEKIRALGAIPVFQTYYKMDNAEIEPERATVLMRYLDVVREVAAESGEFLVDQYKYFDALPFVTLRHELLLNAMHVNEYGNTLIGVNLLHHFGADPALIAHNERILPAMKLYDSIAE